MSLDLDEVIAEMHEVLDALEREATSDNSTPAGVASKARQLKKLCDTAIEAVTDSDPEHLEDGDDPTGGTAGHDEDE